MAMAQAEVRQFSAAVMWQRDAMSAARRTAGLGVAGLMADNLRLSQSGKPCRTPWRPDEPLEFAEHRRRSCAGRWPRRGIKR